MDISDPVVTESKPPESTKADEAALELMKQLITLASGVLALGAAFVDKLPKTPVYLLVLLFLSWTALIISLIYGIRTISTIVKSRLNSDDEWSRGEGRTFGRRCQTSFLIGIGLFAAFAFVSLAWPSSNKEATRVHIEAVDQRVIEGLKSSKPDQSSPSSGR
ncbi:MAG TPA: hypothetical protein VE135_10905 [Pyrinomonadaceae bacterium]|nr:hypothetical protein [Pyrinomonadaceae bacterium]